MLFHILFGWGTRQIHRALVKNTSRVVLTPNEISYEVEMFFLEDMEFISFASKMG